MRRAISLWALGWAGLFDPAAGQAQGALELRPDRDASKAVSLEAAYTGDLIAVVEGGRERGTRYLHNVDLIAAIDSDILGWRGTRLFAYVLGNHGGAPSALVGDAQTMDNIEAPASWKLYEVWLQQRLADDRLSLLLGLYDLNSEFDLNRSGALFVHSAHGIGTDFAQSGRNGPSIFPHTALGVRIRSLPSPRLYLQAVVLDAVPGDPDDPTGTHVGISTDEGALLVLEGGFVRGGLGERPAGRRSEDGSGGPARLRRIGREGAAAYEAKLAAGAWWYTSRQPVVAGAGGAPEATSAGAYLLAEGPLAREASASQGLWGFARIGWAGSRANRFGWYTGGGLVYRGPVPGRAGDEAGVAVAAAHNGDPFLRARRAEGSPRGRTETALEITYWAEPTPWLGLQLDIQRVLNPDTDPSLRDATAVGVRVVLSP